MFVCLFQIANNTGYIQVDWKRVEKDVNKAKKQLKKGANQAGPELNSFVDKVSPKVLPKVYFHFLTQEHCFGSLSIKYLVLSI